MSNISNKIIKNISGALLECLFSVAEGFMIYTDRNSVYKIVYGHYKKELTLGKIKKHFCDLKYRGYIELKKQSGKESIVLTSKAKLALLDKIAETLERDGRYYFISFDIPEKMRRNRDLFRRAVKRLGFRELQKSLWVCNHNAGEFVELAIKEYNVSEYVVYIISDITNVNKTINDITKR